MQYYQRSRKIAALSSGKIEKHENLTVVEILLSNWRQIIRQAKFIYSALGKVLEKQTKKQVHALRSLNLCNNTNELKQSEEIFPKKLLNYLIINKLKKVIKLKILLKQIGYIINQKRR